MTFSILWRVFSWSALLTAVAALLVALRGTSSVDLREIATAPAGISAAAIDPELLARFSPVPNPSQKACDHTAADAVTLHPSKPTKIFEFQPMSKEAPGQLVAYLQDPITETVVFSSVDRQGCRWVSASGRAFPFEQRAFVDPFPNVLLPEQLDAKAPITVLIQDAKTIRPWVYTTDASRFQRISTTIWMGLASFSTMLLAATFIVVGFTGLMRQSVVWSFVVYVVCFLFWLSQNFSIVSAGLGVWPEGAYFPLMQALAVASVVLGIGMASIEFLQLTPLSKVWYRVGVVACALAFISSAWVPVGYKMGSAILGVVALAIGWALMRKLKSADLPFKLFASGLTATMLGGGVQAASVLTGGGSSGYWPIFAFPLGAFSQGILWMMALVVQSERNRRSQEAKLVRDATFDALTGLYNRYTFSQELEQCLQQKTPHTHTSALFFLGLDRFKLINDTQGHRVGDLVLEQVGTRLQSCVGAEGVVARFGGDEFLVLQHQCPSDADATQLAQRVLAAFEPIWQLNNRELSLSACIGVVRFGADYVQVSDLLRDADTALHRAKDAGTNQCVVFDHGMREEIEHLFKIQSDLGKAIESKQFELHFQPIVHLADGSHAGFEALIRWRHPVNGMVNPAEFIPIAEDSGHIRALGDLIIEMAFAAISDWKKQGIWQPGWYVSINVSGGQLLNDSLVHTIAKLQSELNVCATDIRLELTETAIISNLDVANQIFPQLKSQGIALCMDDFGTGYSSLSYLSVLPFQIIKIDKSFVDDILLVPQQRALIKAMLSMARELGMRVVAEGVESAEQAQALKEFGCDYGQGYHFSRPLIMDAASAWLKKHHSPGGSGAQTH